MRIFLLSLFVCGLLCGSSWYMYNVLFYGSISEGQTITEVLMTAPASQTLQRLSIFSQWPIYIPANATPAPTTTTIIPVDGCGDGYGCQGPNSIPDVRCPSTRQCNVLGKQAVCLQQGACLDLCFVADISSDNNCNSNFIELHGSIGGCLYSNSMLLHYRVSLLNSSNLQLDFYTQTDSLCLTSLSMFTIEVESCTPFNAPPPSPLTSGSITMLLAECSDFCQGDGFGCHLTSASNTLKEYSFCHTSQDCYANGGTVVCSNATFPIISGSCLISDGCGDGYGCLDDVPDVRCPLTRQCLYDGGDPVCDYVAVPSPPIPIPTPTPVVPTTTSLPGISYCTSVYIGGSNCTGPSINTTIVDCNVCYNDIYDFFGVGFKMDCSSLVSTLYDVDCLNPAPISWAFDQCFQAGFDVTTSACPTIDTPTTTEIDCDNCYYTLNTTQTGPTSYECTNIINTTNYCCNECIYIAERGDYWKKTCGYDWGTSYFDSGCTQVSGYDNLPLGPVCTTTGLLLSKCTVPPSPPSNICTCTAYSYSGTTLCNNSPNFITSVPTDVCIEIPSVDTGAISLFGTCTSWTVYYGNTCSGSSFPGSNNTCINDGVNSWRIICSPVDVPAPPPPSPVPPPFLDCRQQLCAIRSKRTATCGSSIRNSFYVPSCNYCWRGDFSPIYDSAFYYKMSCTTGQVTAYLNPTCTGAAFPIANPAPCNSAWSVSYVTTPPLNQVLNYFEGSGCIVPRLYQWINIETEKCQFVYRILNSNYIGFKSLIRKNNGIWQLYSSSDCQSGLLKSISTSFPCWNDVTNNEAWSVNLETGGTYDWIQNGTLPFNQNIISQKDVKSASLDVNSQTKQDVNSKRKRQFQTSVGSCLDNACLPYQGGYIPDVSNSRVQQCMDNGLTPICELISQNATFKCTSLCFNYIVHSSKTDCFNSNSSNIIYSIPSPLSSCTQDLNGRYVKYFLITGPIYSDRVLRIVYTDPTCTVKAGESLINFGTNPSLRDCDTLAGTSQAASLVVAECPNIKYIDHCVPTRIANNYFALPSSDDLEVVSCRSSGSIPYCPYNVDGTPRDYQCEEWCHLDTIWIRSPDTISCVGGGINQPLTGGDPVSYSKLGECSPAFGFYTTPNGNNNPNIRISPFYSLGLISGRFKVLVEAYSDRSCLNFASRAILDQDYCSSNTYRQTLGSCSSLDVQWYGYDNYGCHLRHVNTVFRPQSYQCSILSTQGCSCGTSCNISQTFCDCEENPNCRFSCQLGPGGTCSPVCLQKSPDPTFETQKYYLPNELAPSTISCLQSGGSPHCTLRGDTGWVGACDNICYWQDSFNCIGQQCPFGAMFPLVDSRGVLQKAGDCVRWDSELNSDFPQLYGPARSMRGTYFGDQIALRFYDDDACTFALPLDRYPIPISYRSFQCFSNNALCFQGVSVGDATVLKVATCEAACEPDGYGCGFQNSGSYSSFGLPQLSCPSSQSCLAGCPTAATTLVTCVSEFAIPGFDLAGACPCQLIPVPENIPYNRQYNESYHKTRAFFYDIFKQVNYHNLTINDVRDSKNELEDPNTTLTSLNIVKRNILNRNIVERIVGNPSGFNGCSLGIGLVFDKGQNPTIQIVEGQPLIVPTKYVLFAQAFEFTVDTPDFATLIPFEYDSQNDPQWNPLQMNQGERILLLATLQCGSNIQSITADYDGTFNWVYAFQQQ